MSDHRSKKHSLGDSELYLFCGQLAKVISSGISIQEGLELMAEDALTGDEQELLQNLAREQESTGSIAAAMENTGVFPTYASSMVQIGETTGKVDEVFAALSRHYRREEELMRMIRSALAYPAAMAGMMVAVVVVLLTRVMPIFQKVFLQLGTEMTGFAALLLQTGKLLGRYAAIFAVILALLAAFAFFLAFAPKGRQLRGKLAGKTGTGRELARSTAACRFADAMSLTLSGGLMPEEALELAGKMSEDTEYSSKIADCRSRIENGESISRALRETGLFSGLYARQLAIGERTGMLAETMEDIASQLQSEIDHKLESKIAVLEPALVIVLSVIVGIILLSVMLPLMGIMSGI